MPLCIKIPLTEVESDIYECQSRTSHCELLMSKEDVIASIKWNGYILLFDCIILLVVALLVTQNALETYALLPSILLIEVAFIFLVGSSFEFSSSIFVSKVREYLFQSNEKWSVEKYDTSRRKALPYFLLGFFLFLESLVLSLIIK